MNNFFNSFYVASVNRNIARVFVAIFYDPIKMNCYIDLIAVHGQETFSRELEEKGEMWQNRSKK